MMQRLRNLELTLVCQRAQVIVSPLVETFVDAWEQALDEDAPLPDDLDLLHDVTVAGFMPLMTGSLLEYLGRCRRDRSVPEQERVLWLLVHGYGLSRFPPKERCSCIAKQPIRPFTAS